MNIHQLNHKFQMACIMGDYNIVKHLCENYDITAIYETDAFMRACKSNNYDIVKYIVSLFTINPRYKPIDLPKIMNELTETYMVNIITIFIKCNIKIIKYIFMLNTMYKEYDAIMDIIDFPLEDIIIYIDNEKAIDRYKKIDFMCNLYKINNRYKPINIHHSDEFLFRTGDKLSVLFYIINLYKKDKNYKPINLYVKNQWNDIIFHMRRVKKIKSYVMSLGDYRNNNKLLI
jgi:hypothetical protein